MALVELSDEDMQALNEIRQRRAAHADNQPQLLTANVTGRHMRAIAELMKASGMTHDEVVCLAVETLHSDNLFGI
jgi:hypothetical protein